MAMATQLQSSYRSIAEANWSEIYLDKITAAYRYARRKILLKDHVQSDTPIASQRFALPITRFEEQPLSRALEPIIEHRDAWIRSAHNLVQRYDYKTVKNLIGLAESRNTALPFAETTIENARRNSPFGPTGTILHKRRLHVLLAYQNTAVELLHTQLEQHLQDGTAEILALAESSMFRNSERGTIIKNESGGQGRIRYASNFDILSVKLPDSSLEKRRKLIACDFPNRFDETTSSFLEAIRYFSPELFGFVYMNLPADPEATGKRASKNLRENPCAAGPAIAYSYRGAELELDTDALNRVSELALRSRLRWLLKHERGGSNDYIQLGQRLSSKRDTVLLTVYSTSQLANELRVTTAENLRTMVSNGQAVASLPQTEFTALEMLSRALADELNDKRR